jgi:hypothetical protein
MKRAELLCLITLLLAVPRMVAASVPDAAQPGKSVYASLYGYPGAGFSLDSRFLGRVGFGASFTGGEPGYYPGRHRRAPDSDDFVFEAYARVTAARVPGRSKARGYGVSVLAGVWMAGNIERPLVGICSSFKVSHKATIRANVVYGPSSGIEAGYRLASSLEATMTLLSGRGIFGLRIGLVEPRESAPDPDRLAGSG